MVFSAFSYKRRTIILASGLAYLAHILNNQKPSRNNYWDFPVSNYESGKFCSEDEDDFDPTKGDKKKHPKSGENGWEDDNGLWIKDRAGGNSHGGSAWKRWNKKRDWEKGKKRRNI